MGIQINRRLTAVSGNNLKFVVRPSLAIQGLVVNTFEVHTSRYRIDPEQSTTIALQCKREVSIFTLVFIARRNRICQSNFRSRRTVLHNPAFVGGQREFRCMIIFVVHDYSHLSV